MADVKYEPPAEKVDQLVEKYTPRQLAVAYLRSQRRARVLQAEFDMLDGVANLAIASINCDVEAGLRAVRETERKAEMHRDILGSEKG